MIDAVRPRTIRGMRQVREAKSDAANRAAAEAMQAQPLDWFVFWTPPAQEWRSHAIMSEIGLVSYLPWISRKRRKNRHTRPELTRFALLPRMLFVGFEAGRERFMCAMATGAVTGVLGVSGVPRGLDGASLHEFLRRIGAEEEAIETTPRPVFHPGDRVRISAGAFSGHVVEVAQIRGPKARVLAEVMGAWQEVEVRTEGLEVVT